MTRTTTIFLATAAAAAGIALGAGGYAALDDAPATIARQSVTGTQASATTSLTVGEVYRRARDGVVEITATSGASDGFPGEQAQEAQGSGFVYDSDGHVITNQHVVDGATD